MKCYLLVTLPRSWRIEWAGDIWMLKQHVTFPGTESLAGWIPVGMFKSPEQAADAVADGTTGELEWDQWTERKAREHYVLERWSEVSREKLPPRNRGS